MAKTVFQTEKNRVEWFPDEKSLPMKTERVGNRLGGLLMAGLGGLFAVIALNGLINQIGKNGWAILVARERLLLTGVAVLLIAAGGIGLFFGLRLLFQKSYEIIISYDFVKYSAQNIFGKEEWVEQVRKYEGVSRRISPTHEKTVFRYEVVMKHPEERRKDVLLFSIQEAVTEAAYWDQALKQLEQHDRRLKPPLAFTNERTVKTVFWEQRWRAFGRMLGLPLLDDVPEDLRPV